MNSSPGAREAARPGRVVVCGEIHSPNLGDGVIAVGLTHLIRELLPDCGIDWVDLSGRTGWGNDGCEARRFRPLAFLRSPMLRRCSELVWMAGALAGSSVPDERVYDLLVIGGGQLLLDDHLSFPTKLLVQMRRLGPRSNHWALHGCGVGERFSWIGRELLAHALASPRRASMTVRDVGARENLRRCFPCMPDAGVVPDPGLWAAEAFGRRPSPDRVRLGLGVMAPGDSGGARPAELVGFWTGLAARLDAMGHRLEFFTNGAPEDESFVRGVLGALPTALRERVPLRPRALRPEHLVEGIARCRLVVSERLHAHVVACSMGLPSVGIVREGKLREFGRMTGMDRFFFDAHEATVERVADAVCGAVSASPDMARLDALKQGARDGVHQMLVAAGLLEGPG